MKYEDAWQIQEQITTTVNALGYSVWDLHFDRSAFVFRLELNEHLDEDAASAFCSQMILSTDYEGEGREGALFTLYP